MTPDDFPNEHEVRDTPDDELLEYVRNGALSEQAVRGEVHRRHPTLRWIAYLAGRSYDTDIDAAGGHPSVMRLRLAPKSATTLALESAYDAAVAVLLGQAPPERPTLGLAEFAALAGVAPGTLTGYVARGQAPGRYRYNLATGRAEWDRDVAHAWVRHRVGQGARTDRALTEPPGQHLG